jgi:hypothetical protein
MPAFFSFNDKNNQILDLSVLRECCCNFDIEQGNDPDHAFNAYKILEYIAIMNNEKTCQQVIEETDDYNVKKLVAYLMVNINLSSFGAGSYR